MNDPISSLERQQQEEQSESGLKRLLGGEPLTEEEIKLVNEARKLKKQRALEALRKAEFLKTAYEFDKWLAENEMEPSYSVFMNEFDYVVTEYCSAKQAYEIAIKLRRVAESLAA